MELEDIALHLFMRKNINDDNPSWKMPTTHQMMRRLHVSYSRLKAMMERLERAKLLEIVSGFQAGEDGANIANSYILSDPVQTLDEFLYLAAADMFIHTKCKTVNGEQVEMVCGKLKPEWQAYIEEEDPLREYRARVVLNSREEPYAEIAIYKQTSLLETEVDLWWSNVLETLRQQTHQTTYYSFVEGSTLLSLTDGTAVVKLPNARAIDWCERQLSNRVVRLLSIESKQVVTHVTWEA